jgi:hypothetical protein
MVSGENEANFAEFKSEGTHITLLSASSEGSQVEVRFEAGP